MRSGPHQSKTPNDNVPTPVVVAVLGCLALLAVVVLTRTSTSPSLLGCSQGKVLTPKATANVRVAPSDSADLLLNQKATEVLGRTHYHEVNESTSVKILDCAGDWVEVAITEPDWMRNVRGWVQLREISTVPVKAASAFQTFDIEVSRATSFLSCAVPRLSPPQDGTGALYGCIQGQAETAKFWINEDGSTPGRVQNVKVMWNDWTKDLGDGLHADALEAEQQVRVAVKSFAPELEEEIVGAFFDRSPKTWQSGKFLIEYKLTPGPAIDEHLLKISD